MMLSELRVHFESFTWHKSAIQPQAIFCLLYATKNSENHVLSAVKRHYCQMKFALPNDMNKNISPPLQARDWSIGARSDSIG